MKDRLYYKLTFEALVEVPSAEDAMVQAAQLGIRLGILIQHSDLAVHEAGLVIVQESEAPEGVGE